MDRQRKSEDKKKRKAYYRKCAASSKKRRFENGDGSSVPRTLAAGMTGYLVTCNRQEKLAVMETFRLLNDALQRFPEADRDSVTTVPSIAENSSDPGLSSIHTTATAVADEEEDDEDDIFTQLKQENVSHSDTHTPRNRQYSFYSVRTGVHNCVFVAHYSNRISAAELAHSIFENLMCTKVLPAPNVLRLLPVACTCYANTQEIHRSMKSLWQAFISPSSSVQTSVDNQTDNQVPTETGVGSLPSESINDSNVSTCANAQLPSESTDERTIHPLCPGVPQQHGSLATLSGPKTYAVVFKCRNYDRLSHDDAVGTVISAIRSVDSSWDPCLSSPSVTVCVNVVCKVACLSILEHFNRFRKYNIAELYNHVTADGEKPMVT